MSEETVTVTKSEVAALLAEAVAQALAAQKTTKKAKGEKKGRKPLTDEQKAANRAKVDAATLANFKAKGYKDVRPRDNIRTFGKWVEIGRRVRKGEKSTICGSFALFHIDQTDPIAKPN